MNDKKEILVSVLCITYNHGSYIAEALKSFLMQKTTFDYEIIVIDDASTDGTSEIVAKYAEKNPDLITPILLEKNLYSQGISKLPYLKAASKGKYIAFCEGDDYWTDPLKLQKQADYMESHPECSLCIHNAELVDADGKKNGILATITSDGIVPTEQVILKGGGFCATNSIMTTSKLYFDRPNYFSILSLDYVLQMYLATIGETYCFAECMSAYRQNALGSWTQRMSKEDRITRNKKSELFEKIIKVLKAIDIETENKYHKAIAWRISFERIQINILQGNPMSLLKLAYMPVYRKKGLIWSLKSIRRAYLIDKNKI